MKINLRKASALQMAINEQIGSTEMPISVTIGRYDDPRVVVGKATKALHEGLGKRRALFEVLYSIREKTAAASERAGVARLLTETERIKKVVALLEPLALVHDFAKTPDQLDAAINDLRNETTLQPQYAYQKRESVTAGIIEESQTKLWRKEIADLKRQKQVISDSLLEANVKHEIELSEQEEDVLNEYGIL